MTIKWGFIFSGTSASCVVPADVCGRISGVVLRWSRRISAWSHTVRPSLKVTQYQKSCPEVAYKKALIRPSSNYKRCYSKCLEFWTLTCWWDQSFTWVSYSCKVVSTERGGRIHLVVGAFVLISGMRTERTLYVFEWSGIKRTWLIRLLSARQRTFKIGGVFTVLVGLCIVKTLRKII